jgi:predicted NAD/FAD-dependent oxidoreductase
MIPIALIGAGMAGLACARHLAQAGHAPVLFDKGRGIGGRLATRRADGLQFDHGAQYVNAHTPGFAALLAELAETGAAQPWPDGTGRSHTVGTPGMASLAKAMASGLTIHQTAQVSAITRSGEGWRLRIGDTDHEAARVVITIPAPQVASLLGPDHPLAQAVSAVRLAPCLTLMAAIRAPAPFITRNQPDDDLAWIAQDSSKPGRPTGEVTLWVAQASPAFSTQHLEKDPAAIAALMLPLLCERLGASPDAVTLAAAHRWRYARVTAPLGQPFLATTDATLYLGGDWCLGPRVEAAWTSGTAIASDMLARAA